MFTPHCAPPSRYRFVLGAAMLLAACSASAQTNSSTAHSALPPENNSSSSVATAPTAGESSSSTPAFIADAFLADNGAAVPSAPVANGAAAAAAGQGSDPHRGFTHRLAFEAGGGFNAPSSGDQQNYITWGGQFQVGAGYHFNQHVSALVEFQFIDDKLPGRLIAETGANGGDAHIWSFTVDPVIDLFPKAANDLYVTGGGGFYRKITNFTDPEATEYCDFYYCAVGVTNQVVGHFSSNQGGWNIGGGFTHRLGGVYGEGRAKLFAEVRYLDVLTPAVNHLQPNGLSATSVAADTKLIPVTFGVRF